MIGITNAVETKPQKYRNIRYIRIWSGGNSVNDGEHLVELEVWDKQGVNRALGISFTIISGNASDLTIGTNGSLSHNGVSGFTVIADNGEVQLDLGTIYKIERIKIWHYWDDARRYTYQLRISENENNWEVVFDARVSGTYAETSTGKTFDFTI